jgi:hypothetical protein
MVLDIRCANGYRDRCRNQGVTVMFEPPTNEGLERPVILALT